MKVVLKSWIISLLFIMLLVPFRTVQSQTLQLEAAILLAEMTLEEKVGQVFLARLPESAALETAQAYHLGGYIWFARDFEYQSPQSIKEEITYLQENSTIPLLMAVDEEGGEVTRISSFSQFRHAPFLTGRDYYQEGGWELVEEREVEKIELLEYLGLNFNLAPVVDIASSENDYIFSRSFSNEVEKVTQYANQLVDIYEREGMGTVLKHFPGYGGNVDTHLGIAYDYRTLENLENWDFIPFIAGIEAGADGVMVAHNVMVELDADLPASLSPEVIGLLRYDLGFEGLIMTDDLIMEGLSQFVTAEEAAILAIEAGNDLLISSQVERQVPAVIEAVQSGRITEERLDESVLRILEKKMELGIID